MTDDFIKNARSTLSLSGSDWYLHQNQDGEAKLQNKDPEGKGWVSARVPGNIQADLEAAHLLKPLWYGAGDARLVDVACKHWWYRKDFFVPESFADKRIKIIFGGVDYDCEVWLNGRWLGRHAGMFDRFGFDAGDILDAGKKNRLAVKIVPMPEELVPYLTGSDGKQSGLKTPYYFVEGINKTRQILKGLKSPTNFSYDWGTNIWTLGIWKDVWLEATGPARIDWVKVQAKPSHDHQKATVTIYLEIDSSIEMEVKARFRIWGEGVNKSVALNTELKKGINFIKTKLILGRPSLWWPNGQGSQPLYKLYSILEEAKTGKSIDTKTTRFGIREVRWEQVEGAPPNFINPFRLLVNGRPVRMMGSNIIPPDLLFGRINERGSRLIQLAKNAGMNTLRVWGGGVVLTEKMYNLADEVGIMFSQEFPLANCNPETDPVFLSNLEKIAGNIVKQLRNHPCIIEWSGGNEMLWKQGDQHPALRVLDKVTGKEDGTRIFRATCPIQGSRHSPWTYKPSTHYVHYNDKALTDSLSTNRMMRYGEFGCQTPANLEVWHREIPPSSQWPIEGTEDPILIRKNVVQAVFTKECWLHKSIIKSFFGPADSLKSLVEAGQFLGAEGLRYAIDALRQEGKRIGGFTTWVFNEPWPNGAGSYLVDYDGRPLMNYDFVKEALASVSLSLRYNSNLYDPSTGVDAELWLVNDSPDPVSGLKWSWIMRDRCGHIIARDGGATSIQSQEVQKLGKVKVSPSGRNTHGPLFVELYLRDVAGKTLTERIHIFGEENTRTPLRGLLCSTSSSSVQRTTLQTSMFSVGAEGNNEILKIKVKNTGKMTALFCEPHPLLEYRTDITIINNHVFIPPGEDRTIKILAPFRPKEELSLAQTGWCISCWNVDNVLIPPNEEVLLWIGRRDAMAREYDTTLQKGGGKRHVVELRGNFPESSNLPALLSGPDYIQGAPHRVRFIFKCDSQQLNKPSCLRIHTADQDNVNVPEVEVRTNGYSFNKRLRTGLGKHRSDPFHLAFPATVQFNLPEGIWKGGENILEICIKNNSWFSWDSLDLVSREKI